VLFGRPFPGAALLDAGGLRGLVDDGAADAAAGGAAAAAATGMRHVSSLGSLHTLTTSPDGNKNGNDGNGRGRGRGDLSSPSLDSATTHPAHETTSTVIVAAAATTTTTTGGSVSITAAAAAAAAAGAVAVGGRPVADTLWTELPSPSSGDWSVVVIARTAKATAWADKGCDVCLFSPLFLAPLCSFLSLLPSPSFLT